MRLLSWNLRQSPQSRAELDALLAQHPDLVALQGLTRAAVPLFRNGLQAAGLEYSVAAGELGLWSRWPLARLPLPVAWLAARLEHPEGQLDLHTVRVPAGKPDDPRALALLDELHLILAQNSAVPRLLCGDLQAADYETPDGTPICWPGRHWDETARVVHSRRWQVVRGLELHGWHDAFRMLHGWASPPGMGPSASWSHARLRRGVWQRWRPDHLLASGNVRATTCSYRQDLIRGRGHAPLLADLAFGSGWQAPQLGWQWEVAVANHWRRRPLLGVDVLEDVGALEDEGGGWWVRGSFDDFAAGTFTFEWARAWDRFEPRQYDYVARCWSEDEALDFHLHEDRVRTLADTTFAEPPALPGQQARASQALHFTWIEADLPE